MLLSLTITRYMVLANRASHTGVGLLLCLMFVPVIAMHILLRSSK